MPSHIRPVAVSVGLAVVLLILGTTGSIAEPTLLWCPSSSATEEISQATQLYYVGTDGYLVGADPADVPRLEREGGLRIDLAPGEALYVFLVEDATRAEFRPPAQVLHRAVHEVVVSTPGDAPQLTDHSAETLHGLRQPVRISGRAIPWPVDELPPPSAPREFNPLVDEMVHALTAENHMATWQTLEDFVTRYVYTTQNEQATQWMLDEFLAMGLDAEFHYYNQSGQRRNVIATLPGLVDPTKVVYICAHLDAISGTPETCAPGGDDNASGTAAVIEAARILKDYPFEYTIKFACFNGEEQGLVGSDAYVSDIAAQGEDVIAAYNCDMIAYRGTDPAPPDLVIYTNTNSLSFATTLEGVINDYLPGLLEPLVTVEAISASDHASFWAYGYRAVCSIEDEAWGSDFCPWYHSCNDLIAQYPHDYVMLCTQANIGAVATAAVPINPDGSFLALSSRVVDDDQLGGSDGNGDGDVNPGEVIELWVTVRNLGQQSATNVSGQLAIENGDVTILDGSANWNDIPSGGEGTNLTPFRFSVASSALDSETLPFVLTMTDDFQTRDINVPLSVVAPTLTYWSHTLDDATHGNGNGIAEPGEVVLLSVELANGGGQNALGVEAVLSSENPHIVTIDDTATNALIATGSAGELAPPYRIAISPDAIDGETLDLALAITAGQGYATESGFALRLGSYFFDDVEADGSWSLSAGDDDASTGLWVRVDPNGTIYNDQPCQPEDDHTPDPGTECFVTGQGAVGGTAGQADVDGGKTTLTSPTFDLTVLTQPEISYWRWYTNDLGNNPGEDEWIVEISSDGGSSWTDLERTTASANVWQQKTFLVSDYVTPSAEIVVRFIASDYVNGSLVEAAIDDFLITGQPGTVSADDVSSQHALRLDPARPNPTTGSAALTFALPTDARVTIRLYAVDGRLVRTLLDESIEAGVHQIAWDGRGMHGTLASPGVYFAKMRVEGRDMTRRILLIR